MSNYYRNNPFFIGLITPISGGALTTYESFNGEVTDDYVFDDKYSSIDEYVGGMLCLCFGITMKMLQKNEIIVDSIPLNDAEQ